MNIAENPKIYVAGHTGLLGRALTKKLKERGYRNIVTRTHGELERFIMCILKVHSSP